MSPYYNFDIEIVQIEENGIEGPPRRVTMTDAALPEVPTPTYASYVFYCRQDGTDGQTTATDLSPSAHAITVNGNCEVDDAFPDLGANTMIFPSGGSDKLTIPASTDFDLGLGDYLLAFRCRFTATNPGCVWQRGKNHAGAGRYLAYPASAKMRYLVGPGNNAIWTSSMNVHDGLFHDYMIGRKNGTTYFYVDFLLDATSEAVYDLLDVFGDRAIIGDDDDSSFREFGGHVGEVLIVKGECLLGQPIYEPRTTQWPDLSPTFDNVVLLSHWDGTNGSTTFTDESDSAHTLTANGNAALTTGDKKFGTASLDLPGGTDDCVTAPASTDWDFGTGDFTLEGWLRAAAGFGDDAILTRAESGDSTEAHVWQVYIDAGGHIEFWHNNNGRVVESTSDIRGTAWVHWAICRNSGTTRMFIDGVEEDSSALVYDITVGTGKKLYIGADPRTAGRDMHGQQDDLRLTKSEGIYTGGFPVRNGPFPDS